MNIETLRNGITVFGRATDYVGKTGGHLLGKSCPLGFLLQLFLFYAVKIECVPFQAGV